MRRALFWTGVAACVALLLGSGLAATRASVGNGKRLMLRAWSLPGVGALSLVRSRVQAAREPVLVATTNRFVLEIGPDGRELARHAPGGAVVASATGDLTGDGVDEVVVLKPAAVLALTGNLGLVLWESDLEPGRVAQRVLPVDLDGDKRREVVVASQGGELTAFSAGGKRLWSWAMPAGPTGDDANVRGLDDVKLGRARLVAVARRDGYVAVLDGKGKPVFEQAGASKLRRLRALDLAEGDGVIFAGGDDGVVRRLDPPARAGGPGLYAFHVALPLGETVTELRLAEIDGNPLTREVVAGGKDGRVVALGGVGTGHAGGRVSALAGFDMDGDGRDEIAAGTETGHVQLMTAGGDDLVRVPAGGRVEALLVLPLATGGRLLVVGAGASVSAYRYEKQPPPFWYHPATAVLVGLLVLAGVGSALARFRHPEVEPPPPATGRDWRRQQLIEARQKVEKLRGKGQAREQDVLERLAQIDRQMAALGRAEPAASASARPATASPPPPRRR